jgi:hypothetical protein
MGNGRARRPYRTYAEDFIALQYTTLDRGRPRFTYANVERAQLDGVELSGSTGWVLSAPRSRTPSHAAAISAPASGSSTAVPHG